MEGEDAPGQLAPYPGINIERFNFNFSDPNTEVDGQRSHKDTPHPFFSDDAVRQAIATAIERLTATLPDGPWFPHQQLTRDFGSDQRTEHQQWRQTVS